METVRGLTKNEELHSAGSPANVSTESADEAIQETLPVNDSAESERLTETGASSSVPVSHAEIEDAHEETTDESVVEGEEFHEHHEQYANFSKEDFAKLLEDLLPSNDLKKTDAVLKQVRPLFDQIKEHDRQDALTRFIAEGGSEDDFDYKYDATTQRFENAYRQLKEKRTRFIQDTEKSKEKNLQAKNALLEKLRHVVDSEETNASIEVLKAIQDEWKTIGQVASQHNSNLWASYNALIERFYSNRSIYFELKELDRKRNLVAKNELCDKAEKLAQQEPSNTVIKELNDLHEEYKHLGPVPKEEQETIWHRFKAASDVIYSKRRAQVDTLKKEMEQNYQRKLQLCASLEEFTTFDSQKINDWNIQTQAILAIQQQWNEIGAVPKEKAKEISKQFWNAFKTFFHHKNEFFKKLEEYRAKNLQKKLELCEQAEALANSDDLEQTAETLKNLQQEWKNSGPVPEKQKNQIFDRFKAACDSFFNRMRESRSATDRQYEENLVKKNAICQAIEDLANQHESDMSKLDQLKAQWAEVGFVPRKNISSIQKRYLDAIHQFAQNADKLSSVEKEKLKLTAEVNLSRNSNFGVKNLQNKEFALRKRLTHLENDIALWKNNIEFFSHSKTADKLKAEFNQKIAEAQKELEEVKNQIKLIIEM